MRENNYRNNYRNQNDDEDEDEDEDEYRNKRSNRRRYEDEDDDEYRNKRSNRRRYEDEDEDEDEDKYRNKRSKNKSNVYIIIFACIALFVCYCIYVYMTIPSEIKGAASDASETNPTTSVDNTLTYDFIPLYDSTGGDIRKNIGSIDELKAACMSDTNCKGFNSNGWMKNTITPRSSWKKWTDDKNKGLYVKQ